MKYRIEKDTMGNINVPLKNTGELKHKEVLITSKSETKQVCL